MYFIAHRGNTKGPDKKENHPDHIVDSIKKGFNVEIDVWYSDKKYVLGHDHPQYEVAANFLKNDLFWCHAKNIVALEKMITDQDIHCFWHQEDFVTLTSKNYIWTYPQKTLTKKSICVMPEKNTFDTNRNEISLCSGICSDYIEFYREMF
tara:strand:- start:3502 stop:3951 length:450 start_codon:yes stop_codon:yes gene_type:complete